MLFYVKHVLRYAYTQPVYCEPLTVRLRPREEPAQRLRHFRLEVCPEPAGMCEGLDLEGSPAAQVWFQGVTQSLRVAATCVAETTRINPFDFLLRAGAERLPVEYTPAERAALHLEQPLSVPEEVTALARGIAQACGGETVATLVALAGRIAETCPSLVRELGPAWPPERTLAERRGACRDLAVLFNAACAALGLAARFVSGYSAAAADDGQHQLHAWSEVFLPGAGWRGFDPAQGLAVADGHLALTAARDPAAAAPTCGTYRGNTARSSLEAQIVLRTSRLPSPAETSAIIVPQPACA
jgi:transglutaminase-like putative cysteine protease